MADLYLFNSLSRKKEKFEPIHPPKVGFYTCGMTVYDYAHIGHGRKYVGDDVIRRVLTFNDYKVNHVQNVTDVGHLVSDADEGEDKLEKGAKKHQRNVWEVAEHFTNHFYQSMDKLNVLRPTTICKATEHIKQQIDLVKKLVDKGYGYETPEAIYFDVTKFADYGKLFGQKIGEKRIAVREEVKKGESKRNPADFALWFKRVGRFKNHVMHWDSPWGEGFPGWHIECSAMSMYYLGDQFDIHTGGEDHLSVHHPNEIAQAEAATGKKPFVKYWIHHAFLKVNGKKMGKSLGNLYTIEDVEEKGFEPLALRYLYLTAHYRDPQNFTWEALSSAQKALNRLRAQVLSIKDQKQRNSLSEEKEKKITQLRNDFVEAINNDFNTPKALAVVWETLKSNIPSTDKYELVLLFDEVLGLELSKVKSKTKKIPEEIKKMQQKRDRLRQEGKFNQADKIRKDIEKKGFRVIDTDKKSVLKPAQND